MHVALRNLNVPVFLNPPEGSTATVTTQAAKTEKVKQISAAFNGIMLCMQNAFFSAVFFLGALPVYDPLHHPASFAFIHHGPAIGSARPRPLTTAQSLCLTRSAALPDSCWAPLSRAFRFGITCSKSRNVMATANEKRTIFLPVDDSEVSLSGRSDLLPGRHLRV